MIKNNLFNCIIISIVLLLFQACRPETVNIPIETPDSKLVINGLLVAGQKNSIYVNKSNGLLDPDSASNINGVELQLYEKTSLIASFNNIKSYVSVDNSYIQPGRSYQIKALYPGKPLAMANATIPFPVAIKIAEPISNIDWVFGQTETDHFVMMKLQINDSDAKKDYYQIQVLCTLKDGVTVKDPNSKPLKSKTIVNFLLNHASVDAYKDGEGRYSPPARENLGSFIQGGYGSVMFLSDNLFNGKSQIFELQIDATWLYALYKSFDVVFEAQVLHIDEAYYKFITSYARQQSTKDDPFAEKVSVFSNVINGYGIIGSAAISTDSAHFEK